MKEILAKLVEGKDLTKEEAMKAQELILTGQEATFHRQILEYLTAVKKEAKIPVMMGFGIRTAEDVRPMKEIIDGAIVGSHFITLMREHGFDPQAAADYCSTFKKELNEM